MPAPHLLIPFAASHAPGCQQAIQQLALPQLDALLARLTLVERGETEETHFALPHECALARHYGLPKYPTPWAAWQMRDTQTAWAFITPCHWQIGAEHVTLGHPADLLLDEADSRALLDILAPWCAEDGITLHYDQPTRWLACGAVFEGIATASPECVIRRDVRAWLPKNGGASTWQRLHSEMQMLLYSHPWSEARAERGLLPINALWSHGAGRLPYLPAPVSPPDMPDTLLHAALREDWAAWQQAWQALDSGPVARMLAHVKAGGAARLTLCGERAASTWHTARRSLRQRIRSVFQPTRFADLAKTL